MTLMILIPAAGSASRMKGGDKLLEQVDGLSQLRRITFAALSTGYPVIVTLPANRPERLTAIVDLPCKPLILNDASEGMAVSLRQGAIHADQRNLMILPADMPEIDASDLQTMIQAYLPATILRATDTSGQLGHPVIFPADLCGAFAALEGDSGAAAVIKANANRLKTVALPDHHATTDLDTPEEWAAWRLKRGTQ